MGDLDDEEGLLLGSVSAAGLALAFCLGATGFLLGMGILMLVVVESHLETPHQHHLC